MRPTIHTNKPKYIMDTPLVPPKIGNFTWVKSGRMMSASLANARGAVKNINENVRRK